MFYFLSWRWFENIRISILMDESNIFCGHKVFLETLFLMMDTICCCKVLWVSTYPHIFLSLSSTQITFLIIFFFYQFYITIRLLSERDMLFVEKYLEFSIRQKLVFVKLKNKLKHYIVQWNAENKILYTILAALSLASKIFVKIS